MSEELKLLPCPFCGAHQEVDPRVEAGVSLYVTCGTDFWHVHCMGCGASTEGHEEGKDGAIIRWNTRPTPHPSANAGEAMREAAIERASKYVLDNSRRSNASLNDEQRDHDTSQLMKAYRDIIGKAVNSGELAALLPSAPEGDTVSRVKSAWAELLKELGHVLKEPGAKALYREASDLDAAIRSLPGVDAVSMRPEMAELLHQPSDGVLDQDGFLWPGDEEWENQTEAERLSTIRAYCAHRAAIRALPLPANAQAEGMVLVPREVLAPFFEAAEFIVHDDWERWKPDEWGKRLNLITVGQFRDLHAAMIAASKGGE